MPVRNFLVILCLGIILVMPACKKETKPDILLVTIDTLRRDRLGCYGYSLDTTPFLDRLAREGVLFKHAITPIPLTDPSHASILTSLHPLTHQLLRNAGKLNNKVETIAEVLNRNGYYTIGTVAVEHLSGKYNFSQGFDTFSDQWDPDIKDWQGEIIDFNGKWQRVAKSVNKSLKEQIENYRTKHRDKPFFIWVHYYDPHIPYIDRDDILLNQEKKQWIQYDKEVRYTDNHIADIYAFLEEKELTRKLIICITADHGEQLGEHGFGAQHWDFYSETTFVPLIFHGYKIPRNKTVEELVSTLDIGVTLLELVNLNYKQPTDGIPLLKPGEEPAPLPSRDQLVIGDRQRVRSLQLVSFPYSYILNFDYFYKSWFLSREITLPEKRFNHIPDKWVDLVHIEKADRYELRITFPYAYTFARGLNFAVLRFQVEKNNDISVGWKLNLNRWSEPFTIDEQTKTLTVFYPVTPLDRVTAYINFKKGAKITNLRYTFLTGQEFSDHSRSVTEIQSKKIFEELKTLRKYNEADELYNLDADLEMKKNLLKPGKNRVKVIALEGKRKIYKFLDHYLEKTKKILTKPTPERALTKKEKEMLKSLGYL